jgi:hypothetical protein
MLARLARLGSLGSLGSAWLALPLARAGAQLTCRRRERARSSPAAGARLKNSFAKQRLLAALAALAARSALRALKTP